MDLPGHRNRPVHPHGRGWALDDPRTPPVMSAPETAKGRGRMAENAIFHSNRDRGSRYTSRAFADWVEGNDMRLSCSRNGKRHDNAVAESFFSSLKKRCTAIKSLPRAPTRSMP